MEPIDEITNRLIAARGRVQAAYEDRSAEPPGKPYEAYFAAHDVVLQVERELAAAQGEEYAVPLDFPVRWDIGYPAPHLIGNDHKTFLTFIVNDSDSTWDGSSVTVGDSAGGSVESLALVEFFGCNSSKLGTPNDEVFEGHPLERKGMDAYTAQRVINSRWLAELEAINSVHRCYDPKNWRNLNHYVFWFHDSTFECVARSFQVEIHQESMADLLVRVCQRLLR